MTLSIFVEAGVVTRVSHLRFVSFSLSLSQTHGKEELKGEKAFHCIPQMEGFDSSLFLVKS
jgi:hypothetical protein